MRPSAAGGTRGVGGDHSNMNTTNRTRSHATDGSGQGDSWLQRLDRARRERDHLEVAQLMIKAAATAMEAGDDDDALSHAHGLLVRAQHSTHAAGNGADSLNLLGDLLDLMLALRALWRAIDHPMQVRLLGEQARDLAFEIARRCERVDDLGLRVTIILRAAEALERLGDRDDPHAMRARALYRLHPTGVSRRFSLSRLAA